MGGIQLPACPPIYEGGGHTNFVLRAAHRTREDVVGHHRLRNVNATVQGQRFEARGNVYAVAKKTYLLPA